MMRAMRLLMDMHIERRASTRDAWEHDGRVDYPNDDVVGLKLLGAPSTCDSPAKLGFKVGRPLQLSKPVATALGRLAAAPARICSVSLASLLDLNWRSGRKRSAWVSADGMRQHLSFGAPREWSGAVMGINVLRVEPEELERRIRDDDWAPTPAQAARIRGEFEDVNRQRGERAPLAWDARFLEQPSYRAWLTWSTHLRHQFKVLYAVVERMKALGEPRDVRAVYWFRRDARG